MKPFLLKGVVATGGRCTAVTPSPGPSHEMSSTHQSTSHTGMRGKLMYSSRYLCLVAFFHSGDLSAVIKAINDVQESNRKVEGVCGKIMEQQTKVLSAISELKEIVMEQTKKNFTLKGSGYEVNYPTV